MYVSICIIKEIKYLNAYIEFNNYKKKEQIPWKIVCENFGFYLIRNRTDYICLTGQKGKKEHPPKSCIYSMN